SVNVIIYQGGQVFSLATRLNGRVGFVTTMPSTSASIFINNTQLSDTGTYQCLVNNFPDRGGRNIGVIGLTVLVPPSVPACRIQGTLDVGSDIMLFCSSEEGIPTPTYSWEKLDALPRLPHNAMQDQMQGTVTLRNISTSTSGLYQCTSSNTIGKSTCVLNLQVVAPQPQSVGLIAGTIATGVLAVIICALLVVVTLFYWRNKNKYEEEEIPNEIRLVLLFFFFITSIKVKGCASVKGKHRTSDEQWSFICHLGVSKRPAHHTFALSYGWDCSPLPLPLAESSLFTLSSTSLRPLTSPQAVHSYSFHPDSSSDEENKDKKNKGSICLQQINNKETIT
uniref:Immunoglobulin superfamily member 11 n=1 Tax=Oryzias sinensis TaxID=183150 RepID=A0A8C7ZF02_9TELE